MSVLTFEPPSEFPAHRDMAVCEIDQTDKGLATARAQLALAGWTLYELTNSVGRTTFVVGSAASTRVLPDRHALVHFARGIGGAR